MKKLFTLVVFLFALAVNVSAESVFKWAPRSKNAPAEWRHALNAPAHMGTVAKTPKTTVDEALPSSESFGYLDLPDGNTWFVTVNLKKEILSEGEYYTDYNITGITATIYDQNYQPVGYIDDNIELPEGTGKCSAIEFGPAVSKKFFNLDDNYEVMMMVNFTPAEGYGSVPYTRVYSIKGANDNASVVGTMPGYYTVAVNNATDAFSEDFFMEFFTGESYTDTEMLYTFDIYAKASYSTPQATPIKSFTVDMMHVMSDGENEAMPVALTSNGRNVYVTVSQYEKTFYEDPFDPTNDKLSEDNNYVIELWSREGYELELTLKKTTSIPCEVASGDYAMRSYALGLFTYNDDINFNFTADGLPAYIISVVDTGWQEGQSSCYFAVYDTDGNVITTFGHDNQGYIQLNSVAGQEEQFCFITADTAGKVYYSFVDFPSLTEVANIPVEYADGTNVMTLSSTLDRTAAGSGYNYVFAALQGELDSDGNTLHPVAWFDSDGKLIRVDRINGGKDVYMIRPYIAGPVLNPWFFNTDSRQEYLTYVQRANGDDSNATHTELCVVNSDGETLLQYQFDTKDSGINTTVVNTGSNPAVWIAYSDFSDGLYHSEFINLPLNNLPGEGTADAPYQIATVGDVSLIKNNPDAHYILTADIDYGGSPLPQIAEKFTGSLDGCGHSLKNFSLSDAPLFAAVGADGESEKCVIKNLTLSGVSVKGDVGAILASRIHNAELSKVNVYKADVEIDGAFGTLARNVRGSSISECSAVKVNVNGPEAYDVGGLVSILGDNASVIASYFSGTITAKCGMGGIAAFGKDATSSISDCHVDAVLTAEHTIGGIIATSSRGLIERCEVEGEITATGWQDVWSEISETGTKSIVAVGGIAGYINPPVESYDEDSNPIPATFNKVVEGCVVALSAININAASENEALLATAHRIAGHTCIDEDPQAVGYDETTWEPILGEPYGAEPGLVNNYSLDDLSRVQESVAEDLTSTEGKSIAYDDLDRDLLESLGYGFFEYSAENPWITSSNGLPRLYFESEVGSAMAFNPSSISVVSGDKATVVLELENVDFDAVTFNISDETGCMATPVEFDENGNVIVEVEVYREGTYTVSATKGTITATLAVTGKVGTGIYGVASDNSSAILYDGATLRSADGLNVSVYSVSGVLMKTPAPAVDVDGLPSGIYIARSDSGVLKFSVR